MFEVVFAALGFIKASVYYALLISWGTGRFIAVASKVLLGWLRGVLGYSLETLQIIFEDFQPFAADVVGYLDAVLQGLFFVKNGVFSVFHAIYFGLSASVNWCSSVVVTTFAELTSVVLSVIRGVNNACLIIYFLLILIGSGIWFLVTLIPLFVVSIFVYSTYCLGLVLHEIKNLTAAFAKELISIYECITYMPLESLAGLFIGVSLVYICVQYYVVISEFFRRKFRVFVEVVRRKLINLRWSFYRSAVDQRGIASEEEADFNEENYCIICQERAKDVLLLPCKHVCICSYCERKLNRHDSRCPVCRSHIQRTMKVFI